MGSVLSLNGVKRNPGIRDFDAPGFHAASYGLLAGRLGRFQVRTAGKIAPFVECVVYPYHAADYGALKRLAYLNVKLFVPLIRPTALLKHLKK
jgi:hypothetical protein